MTSEDVQTYLDLFYAGIFGLIIGLAVAGVLK